MSSKANRISKKATLELAHDDEARREAKRLGLEVGKRIRYVSGETHAKVEHFGVVRVLHHKSIEVELTMAGVVRNGQLIVIRDDEIPYADVREVLGDGVLAVREFRGAVKSKLPMAPPRQEGSYEFCDMPRCEEPPVRAYVLRKYDDDIGELGPRHIVAICKLHMEPWPTVTEAERKGIPSKADDRHIPTLWQMGVVYEEYQIPKPEPEEVTEPVEPVERKTVHMDEKVDKTETVLEALGLKLSTSRSESASTRTRGRVKSRSH